MIKISGASGFIGNAVVNYCKRHSLPFIGYTRSKHSALGSLTFVEDYSDIPEGGILIHLGEHNNISTINEEIVKKQLNLTDKLTEKKFTKLVYVSSSAVYKPSDSPISSDCLIYNSSLYAKTKLANEKKILRSHGLVARLSNVIGLGMAKNNVLSTILEQRNSKVIRVQNTKPVRDYVWVDDVASALVISANSKEKGIFHVSTGVGTSVLSLINIICEISGNINYQVKETLPGDATTVVLDSNLTLQKFGWTPEVSLKDGLSRIVKAL